MYNTLFLRKIILFLFLSILHNVLLVGAGIAWSASKASQLSGENEYTISGHITYEFSSEPLPGVVIVASTGVTTTTDDKGEFHLEGLQPGSYTITPTRTISNDSLVVFPSSRVVTLPPNADDQDFTAELVVSDHAISGQVTLTNGQPVSGVTLHLGDVGTTVTDDNGRYLFFPVAPGEYTLWPDKPGYSFQPDQRTVRLPSDHSSQDFVAGSEYVITLPLVLH